MNAHDREVCSPPTLDNEQLRADLLNRLKRAEGQLRGIQRMIEGGESCLDIASQMAAVRKALDSTYARMTVCFIEQELQARLNIGDAQQSEINALMHDVQAILGKVR